MASAMPRLHDSRAGSRRHYLAATLAAAVTLTCSSALASEFTDPVGAFRVDLLERGIPCVLAPAERYVPSECAGVGLRPEQMSRMGSPNVVLVGAEQVNAGTWSYMTTILRESHVDGHELDMRDAEHNADSFVSKMHASVSSKGARLTRTGSVLLGRVGPIQTIQFEADGVAETPPGSGLTARMHLAFVLAVVRGAVYTIQVWGPAENPDGPPEHAEDIREIAEASARTIKALPPLEPPAYRLGVSVMRVGALVFLGAVVAAFVAMTRRVRRAEQRAPPTSTSKSSPDPETKSTPSRLTG
jgi:hypothetical protein